jgi:predicted RNA-binding protein with PUA-like domain
MKKYWLMKSEEEEYSISDLARDGEVAWFGVRNYQARNYMRDHMKVGDLIIFYHSNGKPSGAVGIGKVMSLPYPDETQFDKKSKYYYPRATKENPVWVLVDIGYVKTFERLVSIEKMRSHKELGKMTLLQKGSRLSITPVTEEEFIYIRTLGEKK